MAVQYKTQCPHCGAQFKISKQHLRQARGAVRCGSCLQVFQATDHLLNDPAAKPAAAPAPKAAPARPAAAKPPRKAGDDESWAEALLDEDAPPPPPVAPPASTNKWTLDDTPSEDTPPAPEDPAQEQNDTRVSLGGGMELSDSFLSLDEDNDERLQNEDFSSMSGAGRATQSENADESWAEALLQELEEKEPPPPTKASSMRLQDDTPAAAPPPVKKKAAPRKKAAAPADDLFAEDFDLFAEDDQLGPADHDHYADNHYADSLDDDFDDDFAVLGAGTDTATRSKAANPFERSRANIGSLVKWGLLSLAALLVLTAQYLVFNFDHLARTPQWRPFYAGVCHLAGCALPNPSDISLLRGTNLIVRTHPQVAGALIVDAILFNQADYEQPFPVIELSFSSLRGQPVASRRFLPAEYLRGDLTGLQAMPRDVPIRVSFEILNPGPDAENYRLHLHPAPASAS